MVYLKICAEQELELKREVLALQQEKQGQQQQLQYLFQQQMMQKKQLMLVTFQQIVDEN